MISVIDIIEEEMIKKTEIRKQRLGHYPSELEACRRQLFYKWTDTPASDPIEESGHWRMQMGDSIHAFIQKILKERDPSFEAEVSWSVAHPKLVYPIRGRVDGLFLDPETGEKVALEIKTTYGRGVRAIKEEGARRYLPQVAMYLYALKAHVVRAHLVIIARDDADRCEMVVDRDDQGVYLSRIYGSEMYDTKERFEWSELESLIDRLAYVEQAVFDKTTPDRDFFHAVREIDGKRTLATQAQSRKTDWQCSYCGWKSLCWLDQKKE